MTLHPVRELTLLALAAGRILNAEPDRDRRDHLYEHFQTILGEELQVGALSRALTCPAEKVAEAMLAARRGA